MLERGRKSRREAERQGQNKHGRATPSVVLDHIRHTPKNLDSFLTGCQLEKKKNNRLFSVGSASFVRKILVLSKMSGLIRLNSSALLVRNLIQHSVRNARLISSSQKNRDAATVDLGKKAAAAKPAEPAAAAAASNKNWVSYGFDYKTESEDRDSMHSTFLFTVTFCLVLGTFYWAYLPDPQLQDWAQREAYLELRRREAAGLEPISKDFVDPSQIELPSDEELGKTEIII